MYQTTKQDNKAIDNKAKLKSPLNLNDTCAWIMLKTKTKNFQEENNQLMTVKYNQGVHKLT